MRGGRILATLLLAGLAGGIIWWSDHQQAEAIYVVQPGDTLWKIAKAHGITLTDLRGWNHIKGDLIEVGQELRVGSPVETKTPVPSRKKTSKKSPPPSSKWKTLKKPSPESCLEVTGDPDEGDMIASAGLSMEEVQGSLNAIISEALRCEPDDGSTSAHLVFEILVGCDGVVDKVTISDDGACSKRYTKCVADVLGYADFPPHDMPDGMRFTYPVTVEF